MLDLEVFPHSKHLCSSSRVRDDPNSEWGQDAAGPEFTPAPPAPISTEISFPSSSSVAQGEIFTPALQVGLFSKR